MLTLSGGTIQDNGLAAYTISNPVVVTAVSTINAVLAANAFTFSGNISGTGALTKTGVGNVVFTTADTYIGATTITGGTLTLSGGGTLLGTSAIIVSNASTLTPPTTTFITPSPAGVNAVQTLTSSAAASPGGTFTLTFNGATTGAIQWSGTALTLTSNIQNALNLLLTIGSGNSVVTSVSGTVFRITLQNGLGGAAVPTMTFNASGRAAGTIASLVTSTTGVTAQTLGVGGTLTLDNTAVNNANRLNDSASITLAGGTLNDLGAANAASTELVGPITR